MSIKTVFRIILIHAFEQTFQKDSFRRVWNVFHGGHDFYAVVFQVFAVDRHLIFVAGESVKFVNCHIFLWTLYLIRCFLVESVTKNKS